MNRPLLRVSPEKLRLFVSVIDDLGTCIGSQKEYDILRIAGLLRLLIVDSASLADQVNTELRLKYSFKVGSNYGTLHAPQFPPVLDGLTIAAVVDGFSPRASRVQVVREFKKDGLLSLIVILVEGHPITVHGLITHMAHVDGVMHAGEAKEQADEALLNMRRLLSIGGLPTGIRTLRAIGEVVHTGLVPLKDAIKDKYAFSRDT